MPLVRYFSFVGSALLVLLFGLNWWFPPAASQPFQAKSDKPVIRISSDQKLPEAVVIDTDLPTIQPAAPTLEIAELPSREAVADKATIPGHVVSSTAGEALKPHKSTKIMLGKKVIEGRHAFASKDGRSFISEAPPAVPVTARMSLLDAIKEKFGHGFLKLN